MTTHTTAGGANFPKAAKLDLLVISLPPLLEALPGPVNVGVSAEQVDDELVLELHAEPSNQTSALPPFTLYRPLTN